ncbi:ABC transporter ATP-binding protein [Sphingobacterium hungaricum]|uniref:ABC transporter ATP-binding protein n=1 Tax=Sphingobacterium hungaricum TaxID=2082723 RepID=A0A928V0J8_9SPHI|nr:ATP-binding cassette domain-containing protein [Sphingobacterium hungaricum]MBE8714741.1 ABC transporter ATP-binding protein [Sphingobacterium hungaricum]
MDVLSTHELVFQYPNSTPMRFQNLHMEQLQHTLLLGDSGKGKTTLLNLLAGFSKPSSGTVFLNGQDLYKLSGSALDSYRAKHIGFIFQEAHLLRNFTILENIKLAQSLANNKVDVPAIHELLAMLEMDEKANSYPNEISRGQLQRAAIARAIINKPALLIADEPTAALDDSNTQRVLDLLFAIANSYQSTLLIATHDKRIKDHFSHTYQL